MTEIEIQNCIQRMDVRIAELGWSKEEFYEKSGISSASYSQWNTKVHKPTKKKLAQAAEALGLSLDYLLTGEGQKNIAPIEGGGRSAKQIALDSIDILAEKGNDQELLELLAAITERLRK